MRVKLEDTIQPMTSPDYKERFKAEYLQLMIRVVSLRQLLWKWDHYKLDFTPECPRGLLVLQLEYMEKYLAILKARAKIENVDLISPENKEDNE